MQSSAPVGGAMKAATISDLKIQFISRKGNCGECAKKCVNALPHISTTTTYGKYGGLDPFLDAAGGQIYDV